MTSPPPTADDLHPVLGDVVVPPGPRGRDRYANAGRLYTRTMVLWAVGFTINTRRLWDHVEVANDDPAPRAALFRAAAPRADKGRARRPHHGTTVPVVRMLRTATQRRGYLAKRTRRRPFRSVLSVDVEHDGGMPNLKLSDRGTVQVTGVRRLAQLGDILTHLLTRYWGRGFDPVPGCPEPPGVLADIVLANQHFHLGFRVRRDRLRDALNAPHSGFVASFEPGVHDVSVSVKCVTPAAALPAGGRVFPRWTLGGDPAWAAVPLAEALRLVPGGRFRLGPSSQVQTLRVFAGGSVIHIGRWPGAMRAVHERFRERVAGLRDRVDEARAAGQRTLDQCLFAAA